MSEKNDIFKSKFEGIFLFPEGEILLREYKNLIKILYELSNNNNLNDFYLDQDIIKMIFGKYDKTINYCKVSNENICFTIVLNFQFKKINRYKKIKLKSLFYF